MNAEHYNELTALSQEIYDQAMEKLTHFLSAKYCAVGHDTTEQQMEDYLFITEEISAFLLGNALALLEPEFQEKEIETFISTVRRVIMHQMNRAGGRIPPS